MWTPRRILLAVFGFIVFFSAYQVYACFLGGIDGLPPLPEDYWPQASKEPIEWSPPQLRENEAERKLRMAFGEDEKVKGCSIKLEIRARGLVLATEQITPERDGRIKLTPFFIAIFGKDKNDGQYREINTIRSKEAYLTFDRPVSSLMEMNNRKIVAGELLGDIMIVNNRRTPQLTDDISVFTQGPLFYQESRQLVYTKADVRLTDPQCQPEPITITGTGLDLNLTSETRPEGPPGPNGVRKQRSDQVTGVERIRLLADVNMNLWVDADSAFLNTSKPAAPGAPKTPAQPAAPRDRAKVVIVTQGPFVYDMNSNLATFDISQHPGPRPNYVEVTRINTVDGKRENLISDHLKLQFKRKEAEKAGAPAPKAPPDEQSRLDIVWAHATGKQVTLTSDGENLDAFGNDLFYDALKKESILKGSPEMIAAKDGHQIYAKELRLRFGEKGVQEFTAIGPGRINMLDREKGQRTLHARWRDELVSGKEGVYDLLVLKGDASFDDTEHAQRIQADLLKVWLEPADRTPNGSKSADSNRRLARQLEAMGHVSATAPDLRVRDSDRLAIWFKNVAPAGGQLPAVLTVPSASSMPGAAAPPAPADATVAAPLPQGPATAATATPSVPVQVPAPPLLGLNPAAGKPQAPGQTPAKDKPPIELTARSIEAYVLRSGPRNDLEKLWCEGSVYVHQDPSSPEDKGVDIRGETMQLTHFLDGNILNVTGDLAQVQLDKLSILGPEVNIDQRANKAWVQGVGAMRMPSQAGFDGKKLAKTTDLVVQWNKSMFFNGKEAEFHGGIQAEQDNARLICQTMRVTLDRVVSMREGERASQPAKVQTLLCDRSVEIEDNLIENGKTVAYKRITCQELVLDNDTESGDDSRVNAPGPGEVRIMQPETKDDGGFGAIGGQPSPKQPAPPKQPANAAPQQEMKLTIIKYTGKMFADNQKRVARFYDQVEVVHVPSDDPMLVYNPDQPPPQFLELFCSQLDVYTSKHLDGSQTHEMFARNKVMVRAQDFWGKAHEVKYDQKKELIIFEGGEGGVASLYRIRGRGTKPEEVTGKRISYWRKTGMIKVEGAREINIRP